MDLAEARRTRRKGEEVVPFPSCVPCILSIDLPGKGKKLRLEKALRREGKADMVVWF